MEFVEIGIKNSGARVSAYVIFGARRSCCCVLNGDAARTRQVGDQLIICGASCLDERRIVELISEILNQIADRLRYSATSDAAGRCGFEILGELGDIKAVPLRTADSS